jgi:hypothetical protein
VIDRSSVAVEPLANASQGDGSQTAGPGAGPGAGAGDGGAGGLVGVGAAETGDESLPPHPANAAAHPNNPNLRSLRRCMGMAVFS